MANKQFSHLEKVLKLYNLNLVHGERHLKVTDSEGHYLTSVAASPSDIHFAKQTIRYLVRNGVLPNEAKQQIA